MDRYMERLRSWKLRYWIGAGYVVPILLAVSSAILVFWNVEMARREDDKLRKSWDPGTTASTTATLKQIKI